MAIAQPAQYAQAARDLARESLGAYLGFTDEVQQARTAATSAEQERASADARAQVAVGRAAEARQRRDAAVQQRDAAFAQLVQMQVNQGAGASAVPAQPRQEIVGPPGAELQVQTPAQRLDGLLLAYQTEKAARVTQQALRQTEHDKRLRQIRIDFYRETFQKAIDSFDLKAGVATGVAVVGFGSAAAGVLVCPAIAGAMSSVPLLLGSMAAVPPAVGGGVFAAVKTESWIEKAKLIRNTLARFDHYISSNWDPKKAFLQANKDYSVSNDVLGIADDVKRGIWRHPY